MPKGTQPAPRQSQLWTQAVWLQSSCPGPVPLPVSGDHTVTAHPGDAGAEGVQGLGPRRKRAFEQALKTGGACQAEQEDRGPQERFRAKGQQGSGRQAFLGQQGPRRRGSSSVACYLRARWARAGCVRSRGKLMLGPKLYAKKKMKESLTTTGFS